MHLLDDREDVVLAHDHQLFAVDLDLGAGVRREDHLVPLLHVPRRALPALQPLPDPREMIFPRRGFSFVESGYTIPDFVFVSASTRFTRILSPSGRREASPDSCNWATRWIRKMFRQPTPTGSCISRCPSPRQPSRAGFKSRPAAVGNVRSRSRPSRRNRLHPPGSPPRAARETVRPTS